METLINAPIEWAVAELAQPGQSESGDRHLVLPTPDGGLVAVVDGLGHGAEAANAAKVGNLNISPDLLESLLNPPTRD